MAFTEDDRPQGRRAHEVGENLAALSVDELKNRIALLRAEIARIEGELAAKGGTRDAAEALFSRRP